MSGARLSPSFSPCVRSRNDESFEGQGCAAQMRLRIKTVLLTRDRELCLGTGVGGAVVCLRWRIRYSDSNANCILLIVVVLFEPDDQSSLLLSHSAYFYDSLEYYYSIFECFLVSYVLKDCL